MHSLLKIALILFLPIYSMAQVSPLYLEPTKAEADSLKFSLTQNINDTLRMAAYRELALFYLDVNSDSSFYYIEKGIPLAKKLKLKLWEADGMDLLAINYGSQGKYVQSLKAYNEALELATDEKSEQNIWRISKFTNSTSPRLARLSMYAAILSDMSTIFRETENYNGELSAIRKAMKVAGSIDDNTVLLLAYNKLAEIKLHNNQIDSALIAFKKSLELVERTGYKKYEYGTLTSLADIYVGKKLYDSAKQNYYKALVAARAQNNIAGLGNIYLSYSAFYKATGKYDSAEFYAKTALDIMKRTGHNFTYVKAYNLLVNIYKETGNTDSTLVYLQLAMAAKDSLLSFEKIKQFQNIGFDEQLRLQELEKENIQTKSQIRTYSLLFGLGIFLLIALLLYRNNRQKQKANIVLEKTLAELKSTQSQLIQSEKMASLGELTAGIAHEIQNPLNFVNNFSEVSNELIKEIQDIRRKTQDQNSPSEEDDLLKDIEQNLEKINHHGKRAGDIVKGMLQHSRTGSGQKELTDINVLADEYLRLSYHGLKAKDKSFNTKFETDFDTTLPTVNVVPQDIGRVVLNLITNAFYATTLRQAKGDSYYEPTVSVSTKREGNSVLISVKDNGTGMSEAVKEKIFQPFFTTKPTGQGTGLGLSLSYDIVKAHGGELKVESKEEVGSIFIIQLPM